MRDIGLAYSTSHAEARPLDFAKHRVLKKMYAGMGAVYEIDGRVVVKVIVLRQVKHREWFSAYVNELAANRDMVPTLISKWNISAARPLLLRHFEGSHGCPRFRVHRCLACLVIATEKLDLEHKALWGSEQRQQAMRLVARLHAAHWGIAPSQMQGMISFGGYGRVIYPVGNESNASEMRVLFDARLARAAIAAQSWLDARAPQTLIHGDLNLGNLPVLHAPPSVVIGTLDFEYAGRGHAARDLCTLFVWSLAEQLSSTQRARLFCEYHSALTAALGTRGLRPPAPATLEAELAVGYIEVLGSKWSPHKSKALARVSFLRGHVATTLDCLDGGTLLPSVDAYAEAIRHYVAAQTATPAPPCQS
jgi:Ser/Thr protein kinase RdoA (MazF antagonist)